MRIKNPYPVTHPQWKHFGLGVLVWQGKLSEKGVVSWQPDSPAALAYNQGLTAARWAELEPPKRIACFGPDNSG